MTGRCTLAGRRTLAGRDALTAGYLAEVGRRGLTRSDLLSVLPRTGLVAEALSGRSLSRPLFLGQAESQRVNADLQHVRAALVSLPDRLFGGDLAAFGRAAGLADRQVAAVLGTRGASVTQLARADMYTDQTGLRLLEFNMGSGVDGIENGEICRAMLRHPVLREFAREQGLRYVDTFGQHVGMIFDETGFERDRGPMVAVVDWPAHYLRIRTFLHEITRRWRRRGLDAHACHVGQLTVSNGRVRLRGRPVDIIFRIFLTEHLLEPDGPALIEPLIDATRRGQVAMFTPLDAELYGSKIPLAMLSDHANRHLFSPEQLAAFDRVLPWTRTVRPGPVTLEDGRIVDLFGYAIEHQDDLLLKPALLHGGMGVVAGWDPSTSPRTWRDQMTGAMGRPYVLQRRVRPQPELCPGEDGGLTGWVVTWGVFTFPDGYGGMLARAFTADSGLAVTKAGSGLSIGCCLVGG
ncbi:MAG TPA: hypothetical protein VHY58_04470 [Streptosporangiaceae bacterium]|jgi:hypothetical protein|nr:hypothetical protein [Streptosporangiaceae bacterium]